MQILELMPNIGIGNVLLGMKREEVRKVMGNDFFAYRRLNLSEIDTYYSSCFQINYDNNNTVEFIELANGINKYFDVRLNGIAVFSNKAEELVEIIDKRFPYDRSNPESKNGYSYIFKDIGLSLWRPQVFKEEMLQDPWFISLSQENKEYELRFRYFEAVGLGRKGYWDK